MQSIKGSFHGQCNVKKNMIDQFFFDRLIQSDFKNCSNEDCDRSYNQYLYPALIAIVSLCHPELHLVCGETGWHKRCCLPSSAWNMFLALGCAEKTPSCPSHVPSMLPVPGFRTPAEHSECDHITLLLESYTHLQQCQSMRRIATTTNTISRTHIHPHTRSHIHLACIQKGTSNRDLRFPHSLVLL